MQVAEICWVAKYCDGIRAHYRAGMAIVFSRDFDKLCTLTSEDASVGR